MKNKSIKLIALITLLATVLLCFAACGSGQTVAADAKGKIGDVDWDFRSSNQTLTLSASVPCDMKDLTQEYVTTTNTAWANIRSSVKTVVIEDGITSIGDYTFYGMTYLTDVSIPASVTKIGECAFTFCASLSKVNFPSSLTSIGMSAFEGCYSLTSVTLPTSLKTIGVRAFAYCRNISTLLIPSNLTSIGHWAFKQCENLSTVALNANVKANIGKNFDTFYADAFEDSSKTKSSDAIYVNNVGETEIKVWRYVFDEEANEYVVYDKENKEGSDEKVAKPYKAETKSFGEKYSYAAPALDGYVLDTSKCKESYTGLVIDLGNADNNYKKQEFKFYYKKAAVVTTPAETTPSTPSTDTTTKNEQTETSSEGLSTGTIVALCIFGVVIVGVCVGAVLVIRSDKKGNKSTTVRKNGNDQKKKK